ncbi:threonine synthase [Lentzea pudingi]|uniref:Threonine synthase n=1 Tax=Lentzea pudingi TaxID=1789439 RepID=A0ABQ2HRB9_9PSEU|nr:threonine synthase [Lentzea pudingi]
MGRATVARNDHGDDLLTYDYGPDLLPAPGGPLDMWRYRDLLPIGTGSVRYPLAVGGSPLLCSPELADQAGIERLWVKDETHGPSASNKDRATALVLESGLRSGASVITTSSTGNAAIATAIGAAACGVRAVIFVPDDCMPSKVELMRRCGAVVFRVRQGYRAAFELSRQASAELGWLDRNTGVNPLTLEGKKTVAFEVWEQLGRRAPDVVILPVGDGPTLVGFAKGFNELRACGAVPRVPRVIGVQATACQPLVRAWRNEPPAPEDPAGTAADGIAVPVPSIGGWTVDEVRRTGGAFVAVSEDELRAAGRILAGCGVDSEPAGAASYAGLRRAVRDSLVASNEEVVVLVTGREVSLTPASASNGAVFTIDADLGEVLSRMGGVDLPLPT